MVVVSLVWRLTKSVVPKTSLIAGFYDTSLIIVRLGQLSAVSFQPLIAGFSER